MRLRRFLPTSESIRRHRLLAWLGPRLHDRELWRPRRDPVARGIAIGLFLAFVIPLGQIPLAVLLAFVLRANLWASAAATLVANPFTFAPIVYGAYRLGAWVVGAPEDALDLSGGAPDGIGFAGWAAHWWDRLREVGRPLLVGLLALGSAAAAVGYFGTLAAWRIAIGLVRRHALRRRARRRD